MRIRGVLIVGLVLATGFGSALAAPGRCPAPWQEEESKADEKAQASEPAKEQEKPSTPAADAVKARVKSHASQMQAFMKKVRDPEWMAGYRAAMKDGQEAAMQYLADSGQPKTGDYVAEMDEVAAWSLAFLASQRRGRRGEAMLDLLLSEYSNSQAMELVVDLVAASRTGAESRLRKLTRSPHERVKGLATMGLADALSRRNLKDTTEVEALYASVVENYADLEDRRGPIGKRAERALFEIQNLSVGKIAPDIVGKDLDGVEFKLTDYRGKVVLLDFWGNW